MQAALDAVRHYLGRARALVELADDADLARRPAADMVPVGEQLAIAIEFAGRAVLPLAQRDSPAWPEPIARATLRAYADEMAAVLEELQLADIGNHDVTHRAGFADVTQPAEDYLLRFALPNMVFHLTAADAGLKGAGHALGKADFDAIHAYPAGFTFSEE